MKCENHKLGLRTSVAHSARNKTKTFNAPQCHLEATHILIGVCRLCHRHAAGYVKLSNNPHFIERIEP